MTFHVRGVIEGFYGRLWSWEERLRVVDVIGEAGFNAFAYAPKEEPLQNAGWRTPYPPEHLDRIRQLAGACHAAGMELWAGLRPVGISYADDADLELVIRKLSVYLELGADRLLLLADDIPATLDEQAGDRFSRLADAHAWLVGEVLDGLGIDPSRLAFVPTDYHGPGTPYLHQLGATIPSGVDLCWTGADVFVPSVTAAEAEAIGEVLRRPPLIWDNYPVNDEHDRHDLRIGPVRGRDADLVGEVRGFLANAALEPAAGLIPLLTWGAYMADPEGYDPEAAWQRALLRVAGNERDAAIVAILAAAFDRSVIDQGWHRPTDAAIAAAVQALASFENRLLAAELQPLVARGGRSPC
jgi:hyaluronoglucosaminidase